MQWNWNTNATRLKKQGLNVLSQPCILPANICHRFTFTMPFLKPGTQRDQGVTDVRRQVRSCMECTSALCHKATWQHLAEISFPPFLEERSLKVCVYLYYAHSSRQYHKAHTDLWIQRLMSRELVQIICHAACLFGKTSQPQFMFTKFSKNRFYFRQSILSHWRIDLFVHALDFFLLCLNLTANGKNRARHVLQHLAWGSAGVLFLFVFPVRFLLFVPSPSESESEFLFLPLLFAGTGHMESSMDFKTLAVPSMVLSSLLEDAVGARCWETDPSSAGSSDVWAGPLFKYPPPLMVVFALLLVPPQRIWAKQACGPKWSEAVTYELSLLEDFVNPVFLILLELGVRTSQKKESKKKHIN